MNGFVNKDKVAVHLIVTVDDGAMKKDYLMTGAEAHKLADAVEWGEISITHPDALEVKTAEEVLEEWIR